MKNFDISDLKNLRKDTEIPSITIKRKVEKMVRSSSDCSAEVEFIEEKTGRYRIILEGKLAEADHLDSSYYLG
jgi:hypothetical protein